MNDDLVAFLRERLGDDEAAARAAGSASMEWREDSAWLHDLRDPLPSQRRAYALSSCVELLTDAEAVHIARHDPARVLADVDAKRRIIDLHGPGFSFPDECGLCNETLPCDTLRLLALPYADHPNYRPEWRP